jgi:hypothetical protein
MRLDWIHARGRFLLTGFGAFSLVCVFGAATPERPAQPARPAAAAATAGAAVEPERPAAPAAQAPMAEEAGPLEITVLRVGRAPFAWSEPDARTGRRPLLSFITDDAGTCRVAAWARVLGLPAASREIRWRIEPPAGFTLAGEPGAGAELRAVLTRPEAPAPDGGPLTITVRASVELEGRRYEVTQTVAQDTRDQMRQEYVDLGREVVPERQKFLDAAEFAQRFGKRFPTIQFEEINFSLNSATGERYPYALVTDVLMLGLKRAQRLLGTEFHFTSGYRNPRRQEQVHAPVDESQHQYGYAADLLVRPGEGREAPNEADWLRMAEAACAVGAHFVEPMTLCHVNTTSCHLHMDFRESGVVTVPVRVKGVVRDSVTGQPIAGAVVTLAGMPARTGPNGYFAVRNVLSARERPLEVEAAGYLPTTQTVTVAAGTTEAQLALEPGPRPALAVTAGQAAWKNEAAGVGTLELRLENTGAVDAADVRLRAAGFQVAPERVPSLPVGKVFKLTLFFRRERGGEPAPLQVALESAYTGPDGYLGNQSLAVEAAAPAWTTLPLPPEATRPAASPATRPNALSAAAGVGSTAAVLGGAVALQRRKQRKGDAVAEAREGTASAAPGGVAPTSKEPAEAPRNSEAEREGAGVR